MTDPAAPANEFEVSIGDPRLAAPVLERLVSAAAVRAALPVDRVVNAMTAVDALTHALDATLDGRRRTVKISIVPGALNLCIDGITGDEAEAIRRSAAIPGVGDVLERTAASVEIEERGSGSALLIALD